MTQKDLKIIVKKALKEDLGKGDITSNSLIPVSTKAKACLVFKTEGVVCGLDFAQCVFKTMSKNISFRSLVEEGASVPAQTVVAVIQGPARAILSAERVAINFLTHLSAIATKTRSFVNTIRPYKSKIYDTRKTTPLLRSLDRYAVKTGGAENHRFNLYVMAMIKDNHRSLLGSCGLKEAVDKIKNKTKREVVLEVDTLEELKEALSSQAEVILLDNMKPAEVQEAVRLRDRFNPKILLEASGGINLANVRTYAQTKVDRISIGTLSSVKEPIDISLDFTV